MFNMKQHHLLNHFDFYCQLTNKPILQKMTIFINVPTTQNKTYSF